MTNHLQVRSRRRQVCRACRRRPRQPPRSGASRARRSPTSRSTSSRNASSTRSTSRRPTETRSPTRSPSATHRFHTLLIIFIKTGKGNLYSIIKRRAPELIPVLGSQPAGDLSHKLFLFCLLSLVNSCFNSVFFAAILW